MNTCDTVVWVCSVPKSNTVPVLNPKAPPITPYSGVSSSYEATVYGCHMHQWWHSHCLTACAMGMPPNLHLHQPPPQPPALTVLHVQVPKHEWDHSVNHRHCTWWQWHGCHHCNADAAATPTPHSTSTPCSTPDPPWLWFTQPSHVGVLIISLLNCGEWDVFSPLN